ncbi:hypothetical protein D1610_14760 [Sphingomonas gilva]|uniref:Tetratricopeptide repeat protein n=1 Tax=Sphingomonas gilva TaxID=2305907 RepID=A0A396RST3_9SPHN|nr:hypothetical protein D1610_14760 [Sphingomonas gilva]
MILFAVGWLIFRNVVIQTAPASGSHWLARVSPNALALVPDGASITPEQQDAFRARLAAAARHAPLEGSPLRLSAQRDLSTNNRADAFRKLLIAKAIDPRDEIVRLNLMGELLRRKQPEKAIVEAEAAMRLSPQLTPQLAPLLPAIASTPAGEAALRRSIANNPSWRSYIVREGRFANDAPGLVFALVNQASLRDPVKQRLAEQSRFLWRLINQGDYDTALLAFVNLLPASEVSRTQPVYDSEFDGKPGPPPFNWSLSPGRVDRAVIKPDNNGGGVLQVEFYDDRNAQLALQVMLLPPGRYRLQTIASSGTGIGDGGLAWQLVCHRPSQRGRPTSLARLSLGGLSNTPQNHSAQFEVPQQDCAAQVLTLDTARSTTPAARRATINSVTVEQL